MDTTTPASTITRDDVISALRRMPPERLADVLQFIEFVEYQTILDTEDETEVEALWAAVEAEQVYRQEHPEDVIVCDTIGDLVAALEDGE
jgi:hypothetical protein